MIHHEGMFLDFIAQRGVGSKDVVASSPASYISYLNSVAKLIGKDITPELLRTEGDVLKIERTISGKKATNTIRNYCSAMRQYVAMVESKGLGRPHAQHCAPADQLWRPVNSPLAAFGIVPASDRGVDGSATRIDEVNRLECDLIGLFRQLSSLQGEIQRRLVFEADGKTLKGNELVGWLGEIYGKILLGGKLVSDREEHDFVCPNGQRVSVKTRKGWGSGWKQTSAIPKIEGEECPTDLMFVHLNDDYSIDRVWIYPWEQLIQERRFVSHVVRGQHRAFIFRVDERRDGKHVIYGRTANNSQQALRP